MKKEFIMLKTRDNNERHCKKGKGQCKEWYKKGFIKTYWNGNTKLGYQNSEDHSLSVKRMSVNPKGIDKHSDIIKNPQKTRCRGTKIRLVGRQKTKDKDG